MLFFYLISLPLTLGMVLVTLRYFAGPDVPRYVIFTVGYTWFCSLSIIILVPADIWTTKTGRNNADIAFFWSWSYWGTFILTWAVVPTLQGYEDAGDFTMSERLKTSIHANLVFYLTVGAISLFGLILLVIMHKIWSGGIVGFAMACSNTFGLVTGAFLLGFGLSEIPKSIWSNADWDHRSKVLSHRVAKMAVNLDNAHQEFSNAIVVAQATSNQMPKRDPLRYCMDIIDKMVQQMFHEDPSFKPSGGRLGEDDMDYDTDERSMATLRRQLRRAREEYYRYKSLYMTSVIEALELEDTIKNYKRWEMTEWKYISSFRPGRSGTFGGFLDTLEFIWRCMLRNQLEKMFSIILAITSAAILLAEATLLPSGVNLSLFSMLINAVGNQEILVQITAFIPLMYMCICTYYSLFKIGMLMFYSFTPKQTSSVSLLMICSMVARYAPPISYNFLNLIYLGGNSKTVFEKRMGNIDEAVPFFGQGFNKIYPLIMVVYTLLVASNFFGQVFSFLGKWKRFKLQNEEDSDGFNPSGIMILQKEKIFLEQGHMVGEQVVPLARNFNNSSFDIESDNNLLNKPDVEMKPDTSQNKDHLNAGQSKLPKGGTQRYNSSREQQIQKSSLGLKEKDGFVLDPDESQTNRSNDQVIAANPSSSSSSSGISTWVSSMKTGFQRFKANLEAKKLLSSGQTQEANMTSHVSSSESLDEIFFKLKQRPSRSLDDDIDVENDDNPSSKSNK